MAMFTANNTLPPFPFRQALDRENLTLSEGNHLDQTAGGMRLSRRTPPLGYRARPAYRADVVHSC